VSKKTSQKKKVSIRLSPGEAVVVADIEIFKHIIATYNSFGDAEEKQEDKQSWYDVASQIYNWVNNTYNDIESEEKGEEQDW
jgi:hypothetical protein